MVARRPMLEPETVLVAVLGCSLFVLVVMASVCLVLRRRRRHSTGGSSLSPFKHLLQPKTAARPVISMKSAAGPCGLKKSPSPMASPESIDSGEWSSAGGGTLQLADSPSQSTHTVQRLTSEQLGENRGSLNFSLRYSFEKNALQVTISSACNLPQLVISSSGECLLDPYVKLQLLPEKQHKVKTRVLRATLNPIYDEEFTFYGLTFSQLQSTTLHFAVVAFDRYSRDEIVGELIYPLCGVSEELAEPDRQISVCVALASRSSKFESIENRGELLVSLCYQPATNKVTVVVLKAKNLPKFDITGLADPYIKIYMLYNGQRMIKKKTHVKKRTLAPVYNESFVFELPCTDARDLEHISFEFLVMDWDRVTKNEVMARCVIGADAANNTSARNHWQQVRCNPRRQIAEWHHLRA